MLPTSSPTRLATATVAAAIAAAMVVLCLRFVSFSLQSIVFPYPLAYGEGEVLDTIVRLARFQNIYAADYTSPPWLIANYPPGFYLIQLPFVWFLGPAFWYGRLLSQLSALAAALLLASVLYRLTADRAAALVAGLTFLTIPYIALWAQYDRVDMMALALSWFGLWGITRPGVPASGLGAACFIVSSYTRQTAAFPALLAGYCWLRHIGRGPDATRLLVRVVGGGLALFLLGTVLTRGGFMFHVVTGTAGRLSAEQFLTFVPQLIDLIPYLLVLTIATVVTAARSASPGWVLVAAYCAGAAAISLTIAKEGSYINYFLDLCAACGLAAGAAIAWLRPRSSAAAAGAALLIAYQIIDMGRGKDLYDHLSARFQHSADYAHLVELVRDADGPVIGDEALGLVPMAGRTVEIYPFAMTQLARAHLWDESAFIRRVEDGHYSLILLRIVRRNPQILTNIWTERMADAIGRRYEQVEAVSIDDTAVIAVLRRQHRVVDSEQGIRCCDL